MRNLLKKFKIIAIAALIGLSMPSCGDDNATYECILGTVSTERYDSALSKAGLSSISPEDLLGLPRSDAENVQFYLIEDLEAGYPNYETFYGVSIGDIKEYLRYSKISSNDINLAEQKLKNDGYALAAKTPSYKGSGHVDFVAAREE